MAEKEEKQNEEVEKKEKTDEKKIKKKWYPRKIMMH